MRNLFALIVIGCLIGASADAEARDNIKIVGSSTVYPFTVAVINKLEETRGLDADITATGTGGGFLLFCTGQGDTWPDLTGASRPIKDYERKRCERNGVTDITEIKIGFDGIVVANAVKAETLSFRRSELFRALADKALADNGTIVDNPVTKWSEVRADFPEKDIVVIGPPSSSGTRDTFENYVMLDGCDKLSNIEMIDAEERNQFCSTIRGEPHYVEGGEDDTLIVDSLAKDPKAFGIFGFSFVVDNPDRIKANPIDGVQPTFQTISDGSYPLARPLFLYVKTNRIDEVPKLKAFLAEYVSDAAIGPGGYLTEHGLVPLSEDERAKFRAVAQSLAEK